VTSEVSSTDRTPAEPVWKPGPHSQFFRSQTDWERDPHARVYGHQLRRAWDDEYGIGLWAVLCVEGKPTVYFKRVQQKDPEQEAEWQRRLWNQGAAAMLVVEDSEEVRVYSALARPEQNPPTDSNDPRLVAILDRVADALELASFIRSVETGQFYRTYETKFRPERAIDQYLLENLGQARDELCDRDREFPLKPPIAHAFLGRCLFTCYLLERGIIGEAQLRRAGAPRGVAARARSVRDVLEHLPATDAIEVLYGLFRVLREDFNGSMFGGRLAGEKQVIRKRHVEVLHRFLRGDEMKTRQNVLFPLYDFRFIPIEFISAIYEDFLAAEDAESQEEDAERRRGSKRRKAGAYYTPPRLAELVVDIATEGWESLLEKRCLDPACGSGIFLVILFQRMAEEWRRRNPNASNTKRARALRDLLTSNLCGVDVNETASMVACFGLYLAFMDQFDDPRDIWRLAEELKLSGDDKVLPPLRAGNGYDDEDKAENPVIHLANFFGPELRDLGEFHLVIGNPPWVGRNQPADRVLEDWVLNEPTDDTPGNPFIKELANCPKDKTGRRRWFLPNRQSANAFMWKAPLHAASNGVVCLLLPAKVLLANQVDDFQAAWLSRFQVEVIWQLADYRFILFEGADCPAIIARYRSEASAEVDSEISYVAPKVGRLTPRHSDLPVCSDDRKAVSISEVLDGASRRIASTVWKKHFWGTGRDQELVNRLLAMPKLSELAGSPGERQWSKGVGFQPYHEKKAKEHKRKEWEPAWWDKDHLYIESSDESADLILLPTDCQKVGTRFRRLRRSPDKRIFTGPLVLFNRACTRIAFADFSVVFQDSFRAIAGPSSDRELLLFLAAVLNSPLTKYFLFHTSANWGIERDTVLLDEYLEMPFPLPEMTRKPARSREIISRVAARLEESKQRLEAFQSEFFLGFAEHRKAETDAAKAEVSAMINDYFGLCDWERTLVSETVSIFEPSSTPAALDTPIPALRRTESGDYRTYAELLCTTLNGWLRRQPWKLDATAQIARESGLGLLTLNKTDKPGEFREQPASAEFEAILSRIQEAAGEQQGGIAYARGFAFFEMDKLHLLKPLTLRHWTKTAALNDADALMGFMATTGGRR